MQRIWRYKDELPSQRALPPSSLHPASARPYSGLAGDTPGLCRESAILNRESAVCVCGQVWPSTRLRLSDYFWTWGLWAQGLLHSRHPDVPYSLTMPSACLRYSVFRASDGGDRSARPRELGVRGGRSGERVPANFQPFGHLNVQSNKTYPD